MKKLIFTLICCLVFVSISHAKSTGEILTFPANPAKGFQWGYALYLPKTIDTSKKLPILLTMNNEEEEESVAKFERDNLDSLRSNYSQYGIADGVGVPMLVPLIMNGKSPLHGRQLNREVFKLEQGPFARLDRQVLAMLKDARLQLKKRGIRTEKKYLLSGFSTPGVFAWNWAMLHPTKVLAVVVGGHQNPALPLEKINGIDLIFPVGVYDFKQYTGKKFNQKEWRKIPILLVSGGDDYNDPLPYDHVYGDVERAVFKQLYGDVNLQELWQKFGQFLTPYAPNVLIHTYPHLGHEAIWEDQIEFLKKHINGGPLQSIALTDTSMHPALVPIKISHLYFGQQAPIKDDREYLNDTDLILETDQAIQYWMFYRSFRKLLELDVVQGENVILTKIQCGGGFGRKFLQFYISDEEVRKLKAHKNRQFSVRAHNPEFLVIPEDLTFSIL